MSKDRDEKRSNKSASMINRFNILFVDFQIVMTILTVIVFCLFIFNTRLFNYLQLSLGVTLLVMAYNNQILYKRVGATILYGFIGFILLVFLFIGLLGV